MQIHQSVRNIATRSLQVAGTGGVGEKQRVRRYRFEGNRRQGLTVEATGTLVRIEPDGFGVVEISPKKQGRNFGYFTEKVKLNNLTLKNLRRGLRIDLKARDLGTEVLQVISVRPTRCRR